MENTIQQQNSITLDQTALQHLNGSAKWSLFLAIMGFIGVAMMIVAAIFMFAVLGSLPGMPFDGFGAILGIFYLLMALLYFFPIYYLYMYSSDMKTAIASKQSDLATGALKYLSKHHKFLGIMILAMIGLYVIFILGIIAMGVASF